MNDEDRRKKKREIYALWREKNPNYHKEWYDRNKDKIAESRDKRRDVLRERSRECNARKYAVNPEPMRQISRAWKDANRERVKAYSAEYRKNHPDQHIMEESHRRARKAKAGGNYTKEDEKRILRAQRGRCGYCRISLKKVRANLDHITSLAKGGSNWPRNLQWLCESCNERKQAQDPIVFAQTVGLLI